MAAPHDAYAALRIRDYRCLLSGSLLSTIGAEVLSVAVFWELYERTSSKLMIGYAGLALFLPVLLLSLVAGQAADRFSRRLIVQIAQMTIALSGLGLALISRLEGPVELVFLCLMLTGIGRAFSMPARAALLPQLVPLDTLSNAVTWNTTGFQVANISGPALGGLIIGWTGGAATAYVVAAGCGLACALLLVPIRPREVARFATTRHLESLFLGVRFVFRTPLLLAAITLDLFAVLLGGATALLPVFAKDILEVGPVELGWLRAAPAVGALAMAIVLAHRPPLKRAGRALLLSVAGFGVATIVFGMSRDFYLSLAMLALIGALDNISVVVRHTLVQMLTPDEMRGRVAAVNTVFISSSNELGAFESGITAHWWGPVASVVVGGSGTIVVVLLVLLAWPQLLRLGSLHQITPAQKPSSELERPPQGS